jgi:hypothetical protein
METRCVFFAVRTVFLNIIMRSSRDMQEIKAYRADCPSARPSVRIIELENCKTNLN